MPTYDYRCPANDRIIEVRHRMSDSISNWGELCAVTDIDPGNTPPDAPVEKLITGSQVVRSSSLGDAAAPACSSGPCCGGGMCGFE